MTMPTITKKKVPALRFPAFEGEWEEHVLSSVASFSKGKGISKADIDENGVLECVTYGELYTSYGELIDEVKSYTNLKTDNLILSEANDVIIPASGETHIDIATASCVLRSGIALGGDLNIIKSKSYGVFLAYYLNNARKTQIARLAQGSSVIHLYSSQLKLLRLNLPSLPEQQKIAAFLSSIDTRIQQLTRKKALLEQYKKGVMQQIFSQQIRFKDEQGRDFPEWEEKRLGEVATFFSGGTPSTTNTAFYTGNIPFIKSGEINADITEQFISEDGLKNSSAKKVQKGDLLYALYGATSGEVGIAKQNGAINQAVLCIRSNQLTYFLYLFLQFNKAKIVNTYLQGGQGNLSAQIVRSLKISLPSLPEQQKIASFLSALDVKIDQVGQQLVRMQAFKKGLLQQLFV
jgi:type I restriction enzyme S subunit